MPVLVTGRAGAGRRVQQASAELEGILKGTAFGSGLVHGPFWHPQTSWIVRIPRGDHPVNLTPWGPPNQNISPSDHPTKTYPLVTTQKNVLALGFHGTRLDLGVSGRFPRLGHPAGGQTGRVGWPTKRHPLPTQRRISPAPLSRSSPKLRHCTFRR